MPQLAENEYAVRNFSQWLHNFHLKAVLFFSIKIWYQHQELPLKEVRSCIIITKKEQLLSIYKFMQQSQPPLHIPLISPE